MPQIPRQFLNRPQMGGTGRRDRQIARTQPGVADQVNAVIAATRGLDMTPIGDALYKTGTAFERMERERIAAEDELKRMKQMSAARSVIINTTQKIHDAYAEIQTQNLSDPEEVRNLFHQRVQQVMDEDQELLDGIGEYAFEPYTRHITETMTTLQPKLTATAIGNSRTMLEEQLREQRRTAVQMAASIEDDDEAAKVGEMVLGGIISESYPFLSDMDKMAQAKAFMADLTTARFRKKWSDNPKGALEYLDAQTGVDPEVRHKIYAEVVSEASQFNAAIENQQQAQDRRQALLESERFQEDQAALIDAITTKNPEKALEIYNAVLSDPKRYPAGQSGQLMVMAADFLSGKDEQSGPSAEFTTAVQILTEQPTHLFDSWYNTNYGRFNNDERIKINDRRAAKMTREGEASLALEKAMGDRLKDRLLALQILSPEALLKADAMPGGRDALLNNLDKDAKEKLAMLERDLHIAVNGERYMNSPKGANFAGLQKNAGVIEDQIYRQYEQAFKNPKARPLPFAMDIRKAQGMMIAGQLPPADFQNMYVNYITNAKAKDPNYDPRTDPVLVAATEQQKQAKEGAKGAQGARDMEPAKEQSEPKPIHAGIIPDLPPVKPVAIGRTVGRNTDDPRFDEYVTQYGIGAQAIAEESGGKAWAVGKESDGTRSYGIYQINERNMPEFVTYLKSTAPEVAAKLRGKPASDGFNKSWEKLGRSGDAAFVKAQQDYIEKEMYAPAAAAFEQEFGIERGNMPPAIHMALFSTSVQHGGYRKIIASAAKKLEQPDMASPQQILQAMYEARNEYVQGRTNLSPAWKAELAERYQREYQRGLKYLG